jgi:hypothetical protein
VLGRSGQLTSFSLAGQKQQGYQEACLGVPASLTGCNVPLATHLAKLRNCAEYYGWSETERVCHLKASLEGTAASLLWERREGCSQV